MIDQDHKKGSWYISIVSFSMNSRKFILPYPILIIESVTYLGTRTASAWQFSSGWSSHSSCGTFCTCIRTSSRQICSPCCMAQLLGTQTSRGIFRHSVSGWTFRTVFLPNVHFWTGHSSQFSSTYELRVEIAVYFN